MQTQFSTDYVKSSDERLQFKKGCIEKLFFKYHIRDIRLESPYKKENFEKISRALKNLIHT